VKRALLAGLFAAALGACGGHEEVRKAEPAPQAQPVADAGVLQPSPSAQTTPGRPPATLGHTGSGSLLLELPKSEEPIVTVSLQFRSGAVDDPKGQAGITNLTAHLMAEGGTQALDAKALLVALFPMAADLEVRVDKELTTFTGRVHKDHLAKFLPILTDVLLHPRWDPSEFRRLRDDAVNDVEKRLRQADDEALGKEVLGELMYQGHPYGRLTLGHSRDLRSLTLDDLKAHAARVFTRDRLTIGIAGPRDDGLASQLAQTLAVLPAQGAPSQPVPQAAPHGPRFVLVEKLSDSTAISMGFPYALSHADPDWAALSIARSAFGEHRQFNGRLMQRLREARGLNYGDYAYIEFFRQEGGQASQAQTGRARHQQDFTIWLRPVQNENRLFAVRAALYELQRSLTDEPFTEAEVEQTKGFLDGYLLLFDQTESRRLGYSLDDAFYGMTGFLHAWHDSLRSVTAAQVNAAWRKWIDPAKLQIVLAGKDMAKAREAIVSGAPTPIRYQVDAAGKSAEKPLPQLATDKEIEKFPFGAKGEPDVVVVKVSDEFE
jgi:zinc protease